MRRIGHLTEVAQENNENREVIDEIVALSRKYGIISDYTSFLVTDPSENHRLAVNPATSRRLDLVLPMAAMQPNRQLHKMQVLRAGSAGAVSSSAPAASPPPPPPIRFYETRVAQFNAGIPATDAVGKQAVERARVVNDLKYSMVATTSGLSRETVKCVDDKTFYLVGGTWTDESYSAKAWPNPKEIEFCSKDYFKLVHDLPAIAKYLAVGKQVIVVFQGHCYKIMVTTT